MTTYKGYEAKTPGFIKKTVQFEIDPLTWEKFALLCRIGDGEREPAPQGEVVADLIREFCATHYTKVDEREGREFPELVGAGPEILAGHSSSTQKVNAPE